MCSHLVVSRYRGTEAETGVHDGQREAQAGQGEMGKMGSPRALPARYPGDGAARGG